MFPSREEARHWRRNGKDRTTGSEQGPREVGGTDTQGGNKQAPYWEAGVRKAETRGEQGRQRQHGELRPSLHRSTLEALEKNTGQNYIPRDPKTVGWGEKERKTKKDDRHRKEHETDKTPDRKNREEMWRTPQHKSLQRRRGQAQPG